MNRTIHKLCAWSGAVCLLIMLIGFVGLARFIPTPSPNMTTAETGRLFVQDATTIRWGMILSMVAATLLVPFAVSIALQMRRIEGRQPALAAIEVLLGTLFSFEFIYIIFFWQAATFRADRAPELIQLLNDMSWIPFIGITGTLFLQVLVFGIAILLDKRQQAVFPRWLGYYNIWCAIMFLPGTFNVFFKTGPLAWNGLVAFYIPVGVFGTYLLINSVYLSRAVDTQVEEEAALTGERAPHTASVAAEIARLQSELDALSARAAG